MELIDYPYLDDGFEKEHESRIRKSWLGKCHLREWAYVGLFERYSTGIILIWTSYIRDDFKVHYFNRYRYISAGLCNNFYMPRLYRKSMWWDVLQIDYQKIAFERVGEIVCKFDREERVREGWGEIKREFERASEIEND